MPEDTMIERTRNDIIKQLTRDYLTEVDPNNPPSAKEIEGNIIGAINRQIDLENTLRPKGQKLHTLDTLLFSQIADIMATLYNIIRIPFAGESASSDLDLLAIYQTNGPSKGIYITTEDVFRKIAREYDYTLTSKTFNEIILVLKDSVERKIRTDDPNLIAVNNGVFDYKKKELLPFTPEYVFIAKSSVNYDPNAQNINLHNDEDGTDWNVEDWMKELSDDPEIVALLWELLGAIIRPHVPWDKSAWLFSQQGNNGKGTLTSLMRNLCGEQSYAAIPLDYFAKEFALEPLIRASAIIVDENDVGLYIDKAANLKAVVTSDAVSINRKHKQPIAFRFYGFMVQCLNEFPRIKDKTDSFYRRQLFIPMEKSFKGIERKYIKHDYLTRPKVLEYVLKKILHSDYYELSEPISCQNALEVYKDYNDPIREFFFELEEDFAWDLLPFPFLYDLYKAWFKENSPSGSPVGRNTFIDDIKQITKDSKIWYFDDSNNKVRTSNKMDKPEMLSIEFNLLKWQSSSYKGDDMTKRATIIPAQAYRGLQKY